MFKCFLTTAQFAKLQIQLEKLVEPHEDAVRVYVLYAGAVKRRLTYGSEKPRKEELIIQ
ncbi:CRISPR-associated endonuclease Cas2 [Leptolyngbya sp. Cla-17]|uniref:CRISPR-associated endonuclease Cas2 n=1 Tax=Leptolyngbya sp. Cla-17 TaxID=2803751 RepID=UPI0018D9B1A6|nr:CRISPR-associated endonuclease Cas2 [Leptolyngbya sp. Cla-17]